MDPQPTVDDFKTQQMLYHEKVCIDISKFLNYTIKNNPRNTKKWYVEYPMTCGDYKQYKWKLVCSILSAGGVDRVEREKLISQTDEKIKMNKKYHSGDILVKLLLSKGYDVIWYKDERRVSCFGNVTPEYNYYRISKKI
jgi:hypothetical protein